MRGLALVLAALVSVPRYLNLNAEAGLQPADVKLARVLHGSFTPGDVSVAVSAMTVNANKQ